MVWGVVGYHTRSHLVYSPLNFRNYKKTVEVAVVVRKVVEPQVLLLFQQLSEAIFQQDNDCVHISLNVQFFFSAQYVQPLPWPICSPNTSGNTSVGDCPVLPLVKNKVWQKFSIRHRPSGMPILQHEFRTSNNTWHDLYWLSSLHVTFTLKKSCFGSIAL